MRCGRTTGAPAGCHQGAASIGISSRDALLRAALERWEQVRLMSVRPAEAVADPRERMRELFCRSRTKSARIIYSELLKTLDHPVVQPVMQRVSKRRLDYLMLAFRQLGMVRADAQHRAHLTYAAYVGFLQLSLQLGQPRLQQAEFDAYVDHVIQTLIP